ncbi:MAG: hypothetical protein ACRDHU_06470 [Actinomycetota bacterium]
MRLPVLVAATVLSLAALAGCADPASDPGAGGDPQRYQTDGTVLESSDHGPELCFAVAESYPPQCSGIPLIDWDWGLVEGEESASGTTWGDFHVEGTYDGTSITVLEAGPFRPRDVGSPDFTPPCPEPAGGWVSVDLALATEEARVEAAMAAERESDSAGVWVDYVGEPSEGTPPEEVILVAAFTGDLERHTADLEAIWGGPLCVTQHERSLDALEGIQAELSGHVGSELGLVVTQSWVDVVENAVVVDVIVVDDATRAAVEERYGAGAVRLVPALRSTT